MFNRIKRGHLKVFENYFTHRIHYKTDVEKAVRDLLMPHFGLSHDINSMPLGNFFGDHISFWSGDIDRALARVSYMIRVHHLIIEALKCTLRQSN